jgi:hypothetical protein
MTAYGDKPYGLRDVKITNIAGTVQADLPVSQTLTFKPRIKSSELEGDDSLVAVVAFIQAGEWTLEAGGISLSALAIISGQPAVVSGTTPTEKTTLQLGAGDSLPYFKIYGKSLGDGADDIHVKLWKCKATALDGDLKNGQFYITKCSGIAVDDGVNGVMDIVQNETATSLPTS